MDIKTEMARGKWKRMTKGRAREMAKERLLEAISIAYYGFEDNDEFNSLSEEDQQVVLNEIGYLGKRMAKSIGGEYYTQ